MDRMIHILHLEDDDADAELVQAALEAGDLNFRIDRVQTRNEFVRALSSTVYDLILADYRLPTYDGVSAMHLVQEMALDTPFIFVSGTMGEDAAIEGLTQGATDYVVKQKLSRLVPAVNRALDDANNRQERKRAEDALRESEERFRAVAESANDAIVSIDDRGTIIYWNRAAQAVFGYRDEEILGQPLTLLVPDRFQGSHHGGLARWGSQPSPEAIGRIVEAVALRSDGREIPVELSISSWNTREGTFFTGMLRDISERKQAMERIHLQSAALEAAANGIVITDRTGTIVWVNPGFTRLTGFAPSDSIGQNPRILKSGSQDPAVYADLWRTINAGRVWRGELINQRKDGSTYTEEMTITPVCDERGEINHFVAIKQDISDRKQHETEREAIVSVAAALRTAAHRSEMVSILLDRTADLFHAATALLAVPIPRAGEIHVELSRGPRGRDLAGRSLPPGDRLTSTLLASGQSYWCNDPHHDPHFQFDGFPTEITAVACAPLIADRQPIGAIWILRESPIEEGEVRLLSAVADIAANAIHRTTLHEQTQRRLSRLTALREMDTAISTSGNLEDSLQVLLNNVVAQLDVDAAAVLLYDPGADVLAHAANRGFRSRAIEQCRIPLGRGQTGVAARDRQTIVLPDMRRAEEAFTRGEMFTDEGFITHVAAPLVAKGQLKGVLEIFHRSRLDPSQEWVDFLETTAMQAAIAIEHVSLFDNLQRSNLDLTMAYDATIEGWSRALDLRDNDTEGHTKRVTSMTVRLVQELGLPEAELVHIRRGALLHDIGKMGIPDSILFKRGPLTPDEWRVMQLHPVYAHDLISRITYLRPALDIPYCHHERWDGTGYPNGLKREQIPLSARAFAVVDVWDAVCTDRPYRQAWDHDRVRGHIREQAGLHFDPRVVEVFLKTLAG